MAKRTDLKKIMIIGSGPIVIGQAAEFQSMGRATPSAGREVYGRCLRTVCGGRTVWEEA